MYARRTESIDATELEKLISPATKRIFGTVNLINVIEKSLLSVSLTTEDGEIIGFGSFYDYPRVTDYDEADDWNLKYKLKNVSNANSNNSLFMHYFIAPKSREFPILTEIANTVFTTAPDIHFLFVTVPLETSLKIFNDQFKVAELEDQSTNYTFHYLTRDNYMPRLHIRPAKPEDNDDLAPIFNEQSAMLKKVYGEFYIAEMIAAQNENIKCFVAEARGKAIGFMCVSKQSNVDLLNFTHCLENFDEFKKLDESKINEDDNVSSSKLVDVKDDENLENQEEKKVSESSVPVLVVEDALQNTDSVSSSVSDDIEYGELVPLEALFNHLTNSPLLSNAGVSNSLIIQLFAINESYEMRSTDFLSKVFEAFPTRDYLLITVPYLVPEFPLLENFLRLTPQEKVILPHEVYCFHKANLYSFTSGLFVRLACQSDLKSIEILIGNLKYKDRILTDLNHYYEAKRFPDSTKLHALVAESCGNIVGIAILCQEENIEYIRSHYNIEDFIYYTHHQRNQHGRLKHFTLNPIFKRYSKQFIKEVMRKSHFSSIYYNVYKNDAPIDLVKQFSLPSNLTDLVPVRPRRQIVYNLEDLNENAPADRILKEQEAFCLMHLNRKLIMEPKVTINARIVVVGASTTGISFLENLSFCPHLRFNNLYLVSPNGLPDDYEDDPDLEQLMGKEFNFSKKQSQYSSLRVQLTVVKGSMTKIDRKKKLISIDGNFLLPYDHLIISTGLQYTLPCPTEANINELSTTKEAPHTPNRRYSELVNKKKTHKEVPRNFFTVNDPYEAVKLLKHVRTKIEGGNLTKNIIVYGHCFEVYCCIQTLLAMGVPGHKIQYVKPPFEAQCSPLNNPVVERAVYDALRMARVSMHLEFSVGQFNDSKNIPPLINSVSFTTHGPPLTLDCDIFISYFKKVVNYNAFKAMNDACLVFDSRLVIDSFFHTNDPCIRGAGTVTKFKRRFYSDQWSHARFNSSVVGEELSNVFLRLFDPTVEPLLTPPKEDVMLIPMYNNRLVRSGVMPGGYTYLEVTKPALPMSLDARMAQSNYGTVVETGEPNSETGYFRLHINQYNKVETITCLSKKKYPLENFIELYGIHERALNNLLSRFQEGLVPDLYSFFSETWTNAFYHDRFKDLKAEIKELMVTREDACNESFDEMVRKMTTDGNEITVEERQKLMQQFRKSGARKIVDQRLINFLAYNHYHLPMYATPDIV